MNPRTRRNRLRRARKRIREARKAVPPRYKVIRGRLAKIVARIGSEIEALNEVIREQERAGLPDWLPLRYADEWRRPWTEKARGNADFKKLILKHGHLSPNFTLREASGKHRHRLGSDVPSHLIPNAQRHAFKLEIVRHELGDKPLPILSWYRDPDHNVAVGGAKDSRHLYADATDFSKETVDSFGAARFDAVMERVFADGGFGRYPSGSRHGDSRGHRARW